MQSTNPLTEEENNFLDHIEQKIHQQAAKNAEEARQRQVCSSARSISDLFRIGQLEIFAFDLFLNSD